jgi:hypothetical protein
MLSFLTAFGNQKFLAGGATIRRAKALATLLRGAKVITLEQ